MNYKKIIARIILGSGVLYLLYYWVADFAKVAEISLREAALIIFLSFLLLGLGIKLFWTLLNWAFKDNV